MKRITLILLLVFFALSSQAQIAPYSHQNLSNSSLEGLETYLAKAQKTKKIGKTVTLAGASATTIGIVLAGAGESTFREGFAMLLGGLGTTVVGLPIWVTGSVRIKKVNRVIESLTKNVTLQVLPNTQYSYLTKSPNFGLKFTISF